MKAKNPLLAKPTVDLSKHRLHRAGTTHTADLAKWAGLSGDLYEGVHVSPSPAVAAAYALGRLKVDGDNYEVVDAPVLLGIKADCAKKDLGDVDMLTCAQNIVEAAKNNPDFDIEYDDLQDLFMDYVATENFDEYLGLVQSLGDWANRPSAYDFADAVLQLQEFCKRKRSDDAVRDKAIELAKRIVPQIRWDGDVADDCIVAVVVLPPFKPMDDIARQNEPFPYDTSAEEEFSSEPIDLDYLNSFIRRSWKVLWGDPSKAKFWHGTSSTLAANALPNIVNKYVANELSFDSAPYLDEDLEENPATESALSPTQRRKYLGKLTGKARADRAEEIVFRREHRSNEPFETDVGQKTRRSSHAAVFERLYGRPARDVADAARLTGIPKKILDEVYARGLAAWQTGHRPGASQHAWGLARVYSFATGGPTAKGPDADLAAKVKNPIRVKGVAN